MRCALPLQPRPAWSFTVLLASSVSRALRNSLRQAGIYPAPLSSMLRLIQPAAPPALTSLGRELSRKSKLFSLGGTYVTSESVLWYCSPPGHTFWLYSCKMKQGITNTLPPLVLCITYRQKKQYIHNTSGWEMFPR